MKKYVLALLLICFTSCYQNDGVTSSSGDTSFSSEIINVFSSSEEISSKDNISSESESISNEKESIISDSSSEENNSNLTEYNSSLESYLSSEKMTSNISNAGEDNDSLSWGDIIWM